MWMALREMILYETQVSLPEHRMMSPSLQEQIDGDLKLGGRDSSSLVVGRKNQQQLWVARKDWRRQRWRKEFMPLDVRREVG